jgi:hypothetical protein
MHCSGRLLVKDIRTRRIRTVFGSLIQMPPVYNGERRHDEKRGSGSESGDLAFIAIHDHVSGRLSPVAWATAVTQATRDH